LGVHAETHPIRPLGKSLNPVLPADIQSYGGYLREHAGLVYDVRPVTWSFQNKGDLLGVRARLDLKTPLLEQSDSTFE